MGESASFQELHEAVSVALKARGVTDQVKARLRAEIFDVLEGESNPPTPSNETFVLNQLIREYLEFNNYSHALSVFLKETGQKQNERIPRAILARDLSISSSHSASSTSSSPSSPIPLLYFLLEAAKKKQ